MKNGESYAHVKKLIGAETRLSQLVNQRRVYVRVLIFHARPYKTAAILLV